METPPLALSSRKNSLRECEFEPERKARESWRLNTLTYTLPQKTEEVTARR